MSCIHCGNGRLLHHVCFRGVFSKVYTNCFLHPYAFYPTCYIIHEFESPVPNLSNDVVVTCSNCHSSHITYLEQITTTTFEVLATGGFELVDNVAGWTEGMGVEAEEAIGAEFVEDFTRADVMEQLPSTDWMQDIFGLDEM